MLSVLQKQAKKLESELKDKQKEVAFCRREAKLHASQLKERDDKIEELMAELEILRTKAPEEPTPVQEEQKSKEEESPKEEEQKEEETEETKQLKKLIAMLKDKLSDTESNLSMAEVRSSVLQVQLAGKSDQEQMIAVLNKKLREAKGELSAFYLKLRHSNEKCEELEKELKELRSKSNVNEDKDMEIEELKKDLARRDEQIDFLMQVHDASAECDWVNVGQNSSNSIIPREVLEWASGRMPGTDSNRPIPEETGLDSSKVDYLVQMGFDRPSSCVALRDCEGDEFAAVNLLLTLKA